MKLITEDIWPQISQEAKDSEISHVAVAYLGKGSFNQLQLARGSTLVIDASEPTVISGSTNPFEIIRYLEAGIKVFSKSKLHAKIYVFERCTWIGSANVSENSRSNLVECMAVSTKQSDAHKAIKFIESLALNPVTPKYAEYLTTIYKPKKSNIPSSENTLWIQKLFDYEYTVEEQEVHDNNAPCLEEGLDTDEYFVDSVRYKPKDTFAKKSIVGDWLIQIQDDCAYAPVKVLGKASSFADGSVIIFFENQVDAKEMKLSTFKSKLEGIGVSLKSRQYPRRQNIEEILRIWQL